MSLIRAHAAAVRRLHELDPADAGARARCPRHELVKMLNAVHEGVAMEAASVPHDARHALRGRKHGS